jgi:hypothetical protein
MFALIGRGNVNKPGTLGKHHVISRKRLVEAWQMDVPASTES